MKQVLYYGWAANGTESVYHYGHNSNQDFLKPKVPFLGTIPPLWNKPSKRGCYCKEVLTLALRTSLGPGPSLNAVKKPGWFLRIVPIIFPSVADTGFRDSRPLALFHDPDLPRFLRGRRGSSHQGFPGVM